MSENIKMEILYEDKYIIVIKKPAGLATQSANISQKDCVSLIKEHIKSASKAAKGEPYVGVVHRLDQPVSGILVFAKDSRSAAHLSNQVKTDIMNKRYHAVVEGIIESAEDVRLDNQMYKDSKTSKAVIVNSDNTKTAGRQGIKIQKASLTYSVEHSDIKSNTTILKIVLITGRFHQIRAQLANLGHPIAGDRKYGSTIECPDDFDVNYDCMKPSGKSHGRIALVADELTFIHPNTNEKMIFEIHNG